MGLKKLAKKLDDYNERLSSGKTKKIKPEHVENLLDKLRTKESKIRAELAEAGDEEERDLLNRKIDVIETHIRRAEWLLAEISKS
jgi:predicted  nucleic acid-binding Zn-ribbon protein